MRDDLLKEVGRLLDIEAIRRLKGRYCTWVDAAVSGDSSAADALMERFVEDAWGEYGEFGRFEGKENLRVFFRDLVPGLLSFSAHMVHNPVIEVRGEAAVGDWYFEVPATLREKNMAGWLMGAYHEEYVKRRGRWMWQSIRAEFRYATPFHEGWAKTRMVAL